MRTLSIKILILCLALVTAAASAVEDPGKLTPRARDRMLSSLSDFPEIYWIYLDESAFADTAIPLTERARARRRKADPDGLLIDRLDHPVTDAALAQIAATGVTVRHPSRWLRAVSVYADAAQLASLSGLPVVRRIDALKTMLSPSPDDKAIDRPMTPSLDAADDDYGLSQLQNQFVEADRLHRIGLSGVGVLIAIFDTGFDIDHPALESASVVAAYDFINGDTSVAEQDCELETERNHQNYHGTLVWGAVGGYLPGSLIGVAFGADFALAKTEITCGGTEIRLEEDNWVAAAEWADSLGADIITSSLTYADFQDADDYTVADLDGNTALLTIAADIAASKNILVLNAAGNGRGGDLNRVAPPADGDSVIAVGAVNADSTLAAFSSPGPTADGRIKPDVTTLGVGIYTTRAYPIRSFFYSTGTSLSTPLVAGGAALAMERNPNITAAELADLMRITAGGSSSPDNDFGYGLFSAFRSANLPRLEPVDDIQVRVGEEIEVTVVTAGLSESPPSISGINLPEGVTILDNIDGTALLTAIGNKDNPPEVVFQIIADVGYLADTISVMLQTFDSNPNSIYAGPNPFSESIWFYADAAAGIMRTVTIFNMAGEKVWERVNHSPNPSDVMTEWDIVRWDGRNGDGESVAPGVYLVCIQAERRTARLKVLKTD